MTVFTHTPWGAQPIEVETFGQLDLYDPLLAVEDWPSVIAISGVAGAGKSTGSAYLVSRGYTLVKFAGPLKAMLRAIGMTDDHIEGHLKEAPCEALAGKTPRHAMQTLGTQWGRDCLGTSFWADLWMFNAEAVLAKGGKVVVDDCRFANEAQIVRRLGGDIFRLVGRGGIPGSHASENLDFIPDVVIENTGEISALHARIAEAATRWL